MGEVNLTEFVGAVIIVLALSLLIRKGLFKVKRLNKKSHNSSMPYRFNNRYSGSVSSNKKHIYYLPDCRNYSLDMAFLGIAIMEEK